MCTTNPISSSTTPCLIAQSLPHQPQVLSAAHREKGPSVIFHVVASETRRLCGVTGYCHLKAFNAFRDRDQYGDEVSPEIWLLHVGSGGELDGTV